MLKRLFFLIVFCVLMNISSVLSQHLSLEILYTQMQTEASIQRTADLFSRFPEAKAEQILATQRETTYFLLVHQKGKSEYGFIEISTGLDTLDRVKNNWKHIRREKISDVRYFKDLKKSTVWIIDMLNDPNTSVQEDLQDFEWQVHCEQQKEVLGNKCCLAIGGYRGKEIRCWFTRDIPVADGPRQFGGLPGLILEVETEDFILRANRLEYGSGEKSITIPSPQNRVDLEAFQQNIQSKISEAMKKKY